MSDEKKKQCFIIGPIGNADDDHYDEAIGRLQQIFEPAAKANNLIAKRADQDTRPGRITDQLISDIYKSDVIIVDLWPVCDGRPNPNVMYEMGIAHAYDKRVVSFMKAGQKLPFDIGEIRSLSWNNKFETMNEVREALILMIKTVLDMSPPFSPVVQSLGRQASISNLEEKDPLKSVLSFIDKKIDGILYHRPVLRNSSLNKYLENDIIIDNISEVLHNISKITGSPIINNENLMEGISNMIHTNDLSYKYLDDNYLDVNLGATFPEIIEYITKCGYGDPLRGDVIIATFIAANEPHLRNKISKMYPALDMELLSTFWES